MKIQFLGTAAAEGVPAVFCNCDFCLKVRESGGKDIRTRSQSLINDELLIDLPADTYHHFLTQNIKGDRIKYLFVTHSHQDHFYPDELKMRQGGFAHNMEVSTLKVFLNEGAYKKSFEDLKECKNIEINLIKHFETVEIDGYKVTALPARHHDGDNANIYIIEGEKTILYAHDTGYFYDEVLNFIKNNNYKFDLATFDCCSVDIPTSDEECHMGLANIFRLIETLKSFGAVNTNTIKVVNHFSHNGNPLQSVLEERVKDNGFLVAFDGCKIII